MNHLMPPEAPLDMPIQNLRQLYKDADAPGILTAKKTCVWRFAVFAPSFAAMIGLILLMWHWFKVDQISALEVFLILIISFSFFWISLTVFTTLMGIYSFVQRRQDSPATCERALHVALLITVYNEKPWYVLGNVIAMLERLNKSHHIHEFDLFILSDTRDERIAQQEVRSIHALRNDSLPNLFYRRRTKNTCNKVGNIADWVRRWGAHYPAMIILDADSLMTSDAIVRLTDELASDPSVGLIQSFPRLIGAQTIFAWAQQFSNGVFGTVFAEGLSCWAGQEANYWGHNAIIRTQAFAACAGLPSLHRWFGETNQILSHDFVEASLLRRAGWGIRFMNRISGSYEETPSTLIDYIKRDRRWCFGNLQHLRLLHSSGLHPISRFHLFHGAMGYLLSTLWLLLLVMWALIGDNQEQSVLAYFSPINPLIPTWPEMTDGRPVLFLLLMYATLLAPKLLGVMSLPLMGLNYRRMGGVGRIIFLLLCEIFLSLLYVPILMVQHVIAIIRSFLGYHKGWEPQTRLYKQYSLVSLMTFHACESVIGILLSFGIIIGFVTPWLIPIALSLTFSVLLSYFSGISLPKHMDQSMCGTGFFIDQDIIHTAHCYRAQLRDYLENGVVSPTDLPNYP